MANNLERDNKLETQIVNEEIVSLLTDSISDKVENCFLEGDALDKEDIKKQIQDSIPHIDPVMLDIKLDRYIENMEETFAGMEIMKNMIKENPRERKKMFENIKKSTEFLVKDF
jgi:hypothetical protein